MPLTSVETAALYISYSIVSLTDLYAHLLLPTFLPVCWQLQ